MKDSVEDSIIGRFDLPQYSIWKNVGVRFRISPEGLKRMEKGYECTMPEDRFGMVLRENQFYIVRWTGIPIFRLLIVPHERGALAMELFFNGNKEQVKFKSDADAIASLRDTMRDFLGVELEVSKI